MGQLIVTGNFGRDLTPKELFALPYTNPAWPLVATVDDLRQALFHLATGDQWMLADSDGNEIRPATPGQIQPASMQQLLRPRRVSAAGPDPGSTTPTSPSPSGGPGSPADGPHQTPGSGGSTPSTPDPGNNPGASPGYEVTRLRMPLSSVTDDAKRAAIWGLVRELASLVDPAKLSIDIQMVGLDITVTTQVGHARQLLDKAQATPGVAVTVQADEL